MSNENEQHPPIDPQPLAQPVAEPIAPPIAGEGPAPAATYDPAGSFAPPPRPGRLFQLRSVIAIAAAGVVLGGLGGAAITHLADGSDRGEHGLSDRPAPGQGQLPGDGQMPALPPNGQLPGVPQGESDGDGSSSDDDDGDTAS